ncbi:MAG TPA: two-component sensor histidine kinase [Hyphomonas sp.]|nr:two-component sensor histidine kinase [Hyphomonas sp.]
MLARLDTLLTRIVILVTAALLSTFLLAYFIVEFSISSQRLQPRTALHVATVALEELQAKDWPDSLSDKELERLQITDYSLSEYPYIEPFSWGLAERVLENLGLAQDTPIGISLSGWGDRDRLAGPPGRPDRFMDEEPGRPGPMSLRPPPSERGRSASQQRARVSLEIANGNWVNIRTENISVKEPRPPLLAAVMLIVLMVGIGIWAALNAINPLRQMAKAANTLASDYKHEPLVEQGPYDVRESLRAFNRMGRRLETTVAGQRQLLAAIGHDLRTPITSLKLKVEMLSDASERERMSRALAELERITEAALAAATAGQSDEPFQPLDMYSLVDSLIEDLRDLGLSVSFNEIDVRPIVMGRSDELTRALRNLIENAVRYGDMAHVCLSERAGKAIVTIQDTGPGIPEDALERVFEPLVRLEQSRNRETGGHGLGLHIAKNLIEAHSGHIDLSNPPTGGLLVTVTLPLKAAG